MKGKSVMAKGKGKGVVKKSSAPYIGYGANVSAGKKITQQVKKNVRKGVVSAAKARGRAAAQGKAPKKYTVEELVNRGAKGVMYSTDGWAYITNSPLDKLPLPGKPMKRRDVFKPGEGWDKKSRKVGSLDSRTSKSLYERKAAKAYANTKKRMASKGKKK